MRAASPRVGLRRIGLVALTFATVASAGLALPLAGAGASGLPADVPSTPLDEPVGTVTPLVGGGATTTTSTSTTSTTQPSPPAPSPSGSSGGQSPGGQSPSSSPSAAPAGGQPAQRPPSASSGAGLPGAPVVGGVTQPLLESLGLSGPHPLGVVPSLDLEAPVSLGASSAISIPAGPRSTIELLALLQALDLPPATLARILAPFPVAGAASYSDDWGAPRATPVPHAHEGVDVFANRGTPVIAATDGTVSFPDALGAGGLSVRLTGPDGTYYYYAHLDRLAPLSRPDNRVVKGQVLGFVGTSGNAEGGMPHLHFEIHPRGGAAVPPVPYLDRWLAEAMATAREMVSAPAAAVAGLRGDIRAGVPARSEVPALQRAAAARPSPSTWPAALVALAAGMGWAAWLWHGRRSAPRTVPSARHLQLPDRPADVERRWP